MWRLFTRSVLLLAVGLVGVLPVWGGYEAEGAFEAASQQLGQAAPDRLRVSHSFDRGWLRSRAETRISPALGGDEPTLILQHRIVHGPLPLGELLEGRVPGAPVRAIVYTTWTPPGQDAPFPVVSARTRLALDGTTRVDVESPPVVRDDLRWQGVQGTLVAASPAFDQLSGVLAAPLLEVTEGGRLIRMTDLVAEVETEPGAGPGELTSGSFFLAIEAIEFSEAGGGFRLEGFAHEQSAGVGEDGETYALRFVTSMESLTRGETRYGPGVAELELRNLDAEALRQWRSDTAAAASDEAVQRAALEALSRLVSRSPEAEVVRLELDGPRGAVRASGRIGIDGDDPQAQLGPLFALMAIRAEANASVPARLLHEILDVWATQQLEGEGALDGADHAGRAVRVAAQRSAWIEELTRVGWLVRDAQGYRLDLEYRRGQLLLHGLPADPSALQLGGQRSL